MAKRTKSLFSIAHYSASAWQTAISDMMRGDDRTCIIVGAAIADAALRCRLESIYAHCNPDVDHKLFERLFEGPTSALSSFSAKIAVSYAMGLYGNNTFHDLDTIRDIRNKMAHRLVADGSDGSLSFETPQIKDKCAALRLPELDFPIRIDTPRIDFTKLPAKGRFTAVITWVVGGLIADCEREAKGTRSQSELP